MEHVVILEKSYHVDQLKKSFY